MSVSWLDLEALVHRSLPEPPEPSVRAEQAWVSFRLGEEWFALPLTHLAGPLRPARNPRAAALCSVHYLGKSYQFEVDDFEGPQTAAGWVLGSTTLARSQGRLGLLWFEEAAGIPVGRKVWAVGSQFLKKRFGTTSS